MIDQLSIVSDRDVFPYENGICVTIMRYKGMTMIQGCMSKDLISMHLFCSGIHENCVFLYQNLGIGLPLVRNFKKSKANLHSLSDLLSEYYCFRLPETFYQSNFYSIMRTFIWKYGLLLLNAFIYIFYK